MAGGKLPPRQKMIGMMYLVLTALLAMNVSKDILDAFIIVNNGLRKTNVTFEGKNGALYAEFAKSWNENKKKVGPWYDKAQKVKELSDELFHHITMVKANVIYQTEKLEGIEAVMGENDHGVDTVLNLKYIKSKDNYDIPTMVLIGSEPANPKEDQYSAHELKLKLQEFRDALLDYTNDDESLSASLNEVFNFEDQKDASGTVNNWESLNFYHLPIAACLTILSKIQTDIRNAESDIVNHLFANVSAADFKFTTLKAAVIPQSNYVIQGDSFKAEVFIAAYDETYDPDMVYGSQVDTSNPGAVSIPDEEPFTVKNGKGYLALSTGAEGEFTKYGVIKYKGPGGKIKNYPFETTYTVAKPSLVVSADKMNVFYKGVENPVSISVPGVSGDKLTPSISLGSMRKTGNGKYVVSMKKGTKATISVSALMPDGSKQNMGKAEFRVKRIPDPVPYVAQKTGSANVKMAQLKATSKVRAKMENFDFDLKTQVTGYIFSTTIGGDLIEVKVRGDKFNAEVKQYIGRIRKKSKVYFEKIRVKMPDGTERTLAPVSLKVL